MLKKVLTVFLSAILLFNLSACAEKETDVSKINNELLNPCRSTFAVLEETNFLNDLLHDLQWVDISLDGWSATEDLTEKFKKSTFKNGIYTLSSSFNYTIGDSYLMITFIVILRIARKSRFSIRNTVVWLLTLNTSQTIQS